MSGSERPGASRVVAMLQAALGLVLVFVLHVLVGAALLGGAMTSGVDALYRATVWWGGCLGVSQLVYVLPVAFVCWRVRRALGVGVLFGAVATPVLQVLFVVGTLAGVLAWLRPGPRVLGDYAVTYDQQRMVRIGETWLTPHIDANGVGPDPTWTWDGADFRESELCEGVLCPGPESWERLSIGELPGGRLRFTLAGPAVPPGWTVDEALVHDDVVLGFDRTPDRCSSEDHAVVDGHLSRDGSSFWGRVAYHWPAGCEVAGRVLSEPLRIDRGFAARRVIDRP